MLKLMKSAGRGSGVIGAAHVAPPGRMARVINILADVINENIHLKPRHSAPNRECRSLARGTGVRFSPTACESLGITIMTRIIVLTASRASELKERISRAKKMNGLSEREYLFLADLLSKLRRGAGARISGRQLASLIEIEARGQAHIEEP